MVVLDLLNKTDPDELVSIVNPSSHDFSIKVTNIHNKGEVIEYTVKSREKLELPRYAADNVSERLAQRMESNKSGVLTQAYHKELLDQIRQYEVKEA